MTTTPARQGNRLSQPRTIALVTALCALAFANFATAETIQSTNIGINGTGDWHGTTPYYWSPAQVPTSADTVYVSVQLQQNWETRTMNINADAAAGNLYVSMGYIDLWRTYPGYIINMNSGTLTVANFLGVGSGGGGSGGSRKGTFNQKSGTTVDIGGNLHIGNAGGAHGTYNLASGATLKVAGTTTIGVAFNAWGRVDGILNLTGGTMYFNTLTMNQYFSANDNFSNATVQGYGTITTIEGGSGAFNSGTGWVIAETGTLDLTGIKSTNGSRWQARNGGTLSLPGLSVTGTGTTLFDTGGGTIQLNNTTLGMGATSVTLAADQTISGYGSYTGTGALTVDGGRVAVSGGTLDMASLSTFTFTSGTVDLDNATLALGGKDLTVGAGGLLSGSGAVIVTGERTLTMDGTVRASGGTLDLTGFSSVASSSGSGWFVENGGAITLPTVNVAADSGGDLTWGARATAVHSVQLDFTNVTGGNLSITVLDPDTPAYLPEGTLGDIVSLWEIDGSAFTFGDGTVNLVFRYDHTRLGELGIGDENMLSVFHYNASTCLWEQLETTINAGNHTATVYGVSSFSPFAVGLNVFPLIPEPTSFALLGLAGGALMLRRRWRA